MEGPRLAVPRLGQGRVGSEVGIGLRPSSKHVALCGAEVKPLPLGLATAILRAYPLRVSHVFTRLTSEGSG